MKKFLLVFFIFSVLSPKTALAHTCVAEYSPIKEANFINRSEVILKGMVTNISEPFFLKKYFSDDFFSVATIEPLEVYKGSVNSDIKVANKFYKEDKRQKGRAEISAPSSPVLNFAENYVLALVYDEETGLYFKQEDCGRLPQFDFLSSIKNVQEIDNLQDAEGSNSSIISRLKNCKQYFTHKETTNDYWIRGSEAGYIKLNFNDPVILISTDNEKLSLQQVFIRTYKDRSPEGYFLGVGKAGDTYVYFLECSP
jgi:hypothetical protein